MRSISAIRVVGVERFAFGVGGVERADDQMLELGAGKAVGRYGYLIQRIELGFEFAPLEMDGQHLFASPHIRQIDKVDFIEAPLAHQLRRQRGDVIGGGGDKYT